MTQLTQVMKSSAVLADMSSAVWTGSNASMQEIPCLAFRIVLVMALYVTFIALDGTRVRSATRVQ